jgi:hypothetical protein
VHKGAYVAPTKETFGEYLERWLAWATFSTYYGGLSRTGRKDGKGGLSPRSVQAIHVTAHTKH